MLTVSSVGIPYARCEYVAPFGIAHICPVCGAECFEPSDQYDDDGEHKRKPDAYQLHYATEHAQEASC